MNRLQRLRLTTISGEKMKIHYKGGTHEINQAIFVLRDDDDSYTFTVGPCNG